MHNSTDSTVGGSPLRSRSNSGVQGSGALSHSRALQGLWQVQTQQAAHQNRRGGVRAEAGLCRPLVDTPLLKALTTLGGLASQALALGAQGGAVTPP